MYIQMLKVDKFDKDKTNTLIFLTKSNFISDKSDISLCVYKIGLVNSICVLAVLYHCIEFLTSWDAFLCLC